MSICHEDGYSDERQTRRRRLGDEAPFSGKAFLHSPSFNLFLLTYRRNFLGGVKGVVGWPPPKLRLRIHLGAPPFFVLMNKVPYADHFGEKTF